MDNLASRHGASRFNPKYILVPAKEGAAGTLSALRTPEMLVTGSFMIGLAAVIPRYSGVSGNHGVRR